VADILKPVLFYIDKTGFFFVGRTLKKIV